MAAVQAGKEILWLRNILTEFGYSFPTSTVMHMDNQSAISVSKNPEHHGRMKHLDLCFYWLRDTVDAGIIKPVFLPNAEMVADALTKPVGRVKIDFFCDSVGLGHTGLRGSVGDNNPAASIRND